MYLFTYLFTYLFIYIQIKYRYDIDIVNYIDIKITLW